MCSYWRRKPSLCISVSYMVSYASLTDHSAVEAAMAEFDSLGRDLFLLKYGFPEKAEAIVHHGVSRYDARPLFAAAYGHQHGEPLTNRQVGAGMTGASGRLAQLGFVVVSPEDVKSRTRYDSFEAAVSHVPVPLDNLEAIRAFLVNRNYSEFYVPDTRAYIGAKPRSGKPAHYIAPGYISYREEDGRPMGITLPIRETRAVVAFLPIRATGSAGSSGSVRGSSVSDRVAAEKPIKRIAPEDRPMNFCPECFLALPATGICSNCG